MSGTQAFLNGRVILHGGDCCEVIKTLPANSIDAVVTDPPYALVSIVKRFGSKGAKPTRDGDVYSRASAGFMGKQWDTGEAAFAVEFWAEVWRVLKPGGHVAAFSGTRTYHRLAIAIEDSGFEIRDQLVWVYGLGFPKSHDVSKAIDKAAGHWRGRAGEVKIETVGQVAKGTEYERTDKGAPITEAARQWQGWGTALKPSWEPIVLARKPLAGTVAQNVLEHGTGAINVDGCRVGDGLAGRAREGEASQDMRYTNRGATNFAAKPGPRGGSPSGRHPANIVHDGSDEVAGVFLDTASGTRAAGHYGGMGYGGAGGWEMPGVVGDSGSAARFFYSAKADADDRIGSKHPTIKPVDLMQWLCRLITPPGGTVLDPFAGTGTTGEAAWREGFNAILIEREEEYRADIARRMEYALAGPMARKHEIIKRKGQADDHAGPLFGGAAE